MSFGNDIPISNKLRRLSQIQSDRDIEALSHAIFPGTHCPLFGVTMSVSSIDNLSTLVVGTEECTYYNKDFSIIRNGGLKKDRTWSYVLDSDEVVFGCSAGVKAAIKTIDAEENPEAILVVSTCVPEMIGEDLLALKNELHEEIKAKILFVKTEHFHCNSHMPGIVRTLEALSDLMQTHETIEKSVNLLGWRGNGLQGSELFRMLSQAGVKIHLSLPTEGSVKMINTAPAAKLNIVLDFTALPLAKKMKELFNIPYVCFDRILELDQIFNGYKLIEKNLGITFSENLEDLKQNAAKRIEACTSILSEKTFFYGNTMFNAFAYTAFLAEHGMKPLIMQVRELYDGDTSWINKIIKCGYDPYVTRIANIAPLQSLYEHMKPDFYIGHENPMRLMSLGIVQSAGEGVTGLGFELPAQVMESLVKAIEKCEEMKNSLRKMEVKHAVI